LGIGPTSMINSRSSIYDIPNGSRKRKPSRLRLRIGKCHHDHAPTDKNQNDIHSEVGPMVDLGPRTYEYCVETSRYHRSNVDRLGPRTTKKT